MTGELRRMFFRHKVYQTLHAVESDEKGTIIAALDVAPATACKHRLNEYTLDLDKAGEINQHRNDYEVLEPQCIEPTHLLSDIGIAEKDCEIAESEFDEAHRHSAALKKIFESKQERLRQIVRDATNPKPLPLFAGAAES